MRDGDVKAGQQALRAAVSSGVITASLQRQIVAWWSAGEFNLEMAEGPVERPKPPEKAPPPERSCDKEIENVMRRDGISQKAAIKYIEDGGLDMEAYQREVNRPTEEAIDKLISQGPPQWFADMMEGGGGKDGPKTEEDMAALMKKVEDAAMQNVSEMLGGNPELAGSVQAASDMLKHNPDVAAMVNQNPQLAAAVAHMKKNPELASAVQAAMEQHPDLAAAAAVGDVKAASEMMSKKPELLKSLAATAPTSMLASDMD